MLTNFRGCVLPFEATKTASDKQTKVSSEIKDTGFLQSGNKSTAQPEDDQV